MIQPTPEKLIKQANNYYSKVKKKLPNHQNDLQFMNKELNKKIKFSFCGDCTSTCSRMERQFQRAFKTLNQLEKAELYYDCAHVTYDCMFNVPESAYSFPLKKQKFKVMILSNTTWKWQPREIEVDIEERKLTLVQEHISINLRNYIMRQSRNKERKGIALESTSAIDYIQTLRISNQEGTFEVFLKRFREIMKYALKQRISKSVGKSLMIAEERSNEDIASIEDKIQDQRKGQQILDNKRDLSFTKIKLNPKIFEEIPGPTKQSTQISLQKAKSFEQIKQFLEENNRADGYTPIKQNVYFDYYRQNMRKIYLFQTNSDEELYINCICDNFNNHKHFSTWKNELTKVERIQNHPTYQIFREVYTSQQLGRIQITYKRTKHQNNNTIYFFDRQTSIQASQPTRIIFCVTKIQSSAFYVKVTQECRIQAKNRSSEELIQLNEMFLGDITLIIKKMITAVSSQPLININTIIFSQGDLSEISSNLNNQSQDFYSIQEQFQVQERSDGKISEQRHSISHQYFQKQKAQHTVTFLTIRHPMEPFSKSTQKLRLPKGFGKHPFWEGEWEVNRKGQMVSINLQKVKAQNGVLKEVLKSLGKNLISGKNILNLSLPVTIFSTQSFLSNLCNSYVYAPRLLEKAVKQINPIDKLKMVVAFNISAFIAELQMEKPFNPILGQTYQAIIDGCPVYGQQISHHPPISAVLMKGRGYNIFGSFQCKINMGLNTATGFNDGIMNIVFDDGSSKIRYTNFSGELSGLVYGDRKFSLTNSSHYIDVNNRLYLHLQFGKHKGVTEYSRMINGIQGKIVKVNDSANLQQFWKLTEYDILQQYGYIKGCWTDDIYYEEECLFNSWRDFPYISVPYLYSLESDSLKRLDLKERVALNYEKSQQFKEQMQHIQRNDRKLRQKYKK